MHDRSRAAALAAFLCCAAVAQAQQHVTTGPELDYQPSVIQSTSRRLVVVKLSSLASPIDYRALPLTHRAVAEIQRRLD